MRLLRIGTSGREAPALPLELDASRLPSHLARAAQVLAGTGTLRAIQARAVEAGVFASRRNLVVAAPTNSGKTLVGLLVLCEALARGQRAVLLEPLRALAQEKADELRASQKALSQALGVPIKVTVSTGDYRLEGETFADPAPGAELIIATPERLDAILRVPENQPWFAGLGAVAVDEAHLLAEPRRGATLETLITSLLLLPVPPRLALLSATLSSTEALAAWLRPCDVISVSERTPPLEKWLLELGEGADADECLASWLRAELSDPSAQALVFIYQARQTVRTADRITALLGGLAGPAGAQAYHSQLAPAQRQQVRQRFETAASRVVVTTSALAMGVNLPATHVVVRDLTYIGARSPGVAELLQMMGRAGRGDRSGKALVVKRASDRWDTDDLVGQLREERLPPLTSALAPSDRDRAPGVVPIAAEPVASLLLRAGDDGRAIQELEGFFHQSLGGQAVAARVSPAARWLQDQLLAFEDEGTKRLRLTRLGEASVRTMLPPHVGASFGRLIRDLLSLAEDSHTLARWTPLDFLIVLDLLHDSLPSLRRYSADMAEQVAAWCEGHSQQVPMLYRRWLRGAKGHSQAAEVLGSLGIEPSERGIDRDEWARTRGVVATFNAIVLYERAMGRSVEDLSRQFGVANLEGVEEKWRDTLIWLLAGLARMLDIKCFFFHLKEECTANDARIKLVKHQLTQMRMTALELIEQLKYASPLGGMLLAMKRRGQKGVGTETLRRLEGLGVTRIADLGQLGLHGLVAAGVRRSIAKKVLAHVGASSR